jgi:hypothetical protein
MASVASAPIPRQPNRPAYQPLEAVGVITEIDGDKQLEVAVTSVSPSGCTFHSPVAFRLGAVHTLRIGTGPLYLASTVQIVSLRQRSDGFVDVGASFA